MSNITVETVNTLTALAPVKKVKASAPSWAAGVRRAVRGLDRRNIGNVGIGIADLGADGVAVCDGYAVRVWQNGSEEAAALRDAFAALGVEGAAVLNVRGSGAPVATVENVPCLPIEKVLAPRVDADADVIQRVAAEKADEYPEGLVRLGAGDIEVLVDARRVAPFAAATAVTVVQGGPVRFYAAGIACRVLLGVVMPLRGAKVAEEVTA